MHTQWQCAIRSSAPRQSMRRRGQCSGQTPTEAKTACAVASRQSGLASHHHAPIPRLKQETNAHLRNWAAQRRGAPSLHQLRKEGLEGGAVHLGRDEHREEAPHLPAEGSALQERCAAQRVVKVAATHWPHTGEAAQSQSQECHRGASCLDESRRDELHCRRQRLLHHSVRNRGLGRDGVARERERLGAVQTRYMRTSDETLHAPRAAI